MIPLCLCYPTTLCQLYSLRRLCFFFFFFFLLRAGPLLVPARPVCSFCPCSPCTCTSTTTIENPEFQNRSVQTWKGGGGGASETERSRTEAKLEH
ncbi:hypothetical protein BJ546DRAFT_404797 [Cryomyces antarcticus]